MLRKGEWVWVNSTIGVPIGARVKETPSGQRFLVDDDGKEQRLSPEEEASLKIMHPTSVEGVDDMISLGDMTEAGLLRNLLLRHKRGLIYTFVGSVLVAVNPYQEFPIYTAEQVKLYHGRKLGELPPHIFAIAESCYFNMRRNLRSQCCIISGESGAGKTESTKLILQYLTAISGKLSLQEIEKQILESNPILEAFGNSKTIRNDNSSRFGKYLEIFFNKNGVIEGARIEQYLLEKSRVCHQAPEERNYHIFYCILAGLTAEEKKNLNLGKATDYAFLTKGDCIVCEGRDDAKDFDRIRSALKILTFSENQFQDILKLLAAMLHLGNVTFDGTVQNNLETSEVCKSKHFSSTASLLGVKKSTLEKSLTQRSIEANKERVTKPLSSQQAAACRDAVVKAIFNKLFKWIVENINNVIYKRLANNPKSSYLSIGLLDIFGFENFEVNSFEQLCINYANEKLQQFFVGHIFKLEQEEYMKEGIVWNNIKFSDNQNVLDLLADKPCNVFALIDEESQFPKGTDLTFLTKLNQHHRREKTYVASQSQHDTNFGVNHFAGVVHYDTKGFLEKNRDAISYDIKHMIEASTNKSLRQLFQTELSPKGNNVLKNNKVLMTPISSLRAQNNKSKQIPTLCGQFRQSLDSLMKALSICQPFFIRCFKSNNDKKSEVFDRELCVRQLRYSGMIDTIRIRKLGYPVRHSYEAFLKRYRVLLKTAICDPKTSKAATCCEAICKAVIGGKDEWKMGRTQIFLRDTHDAVLERRREEELSRVAVVIQRVMLGHKDRKCFVKKRRAAVVLQKNWKGYRQRKELKMLLNGFGRLVAIVRGRKLRRQYQRQQAAALTIQSQVRGYITRKDLKQKRAVNNEIIAVNAAILLQAHTRGLLARRAYKKIREDAKIESPDAGAHNLPDETDEEDLIGLQLQQRLEEVAAQQAAEKSESESEESESEVNNSKLDPSSSDEKSSESERSSPEPKEIPEQKDSAPDTKSRTSEEEEEEDEFDDETDPFSFYNFSVRYFQHNADHKHTSQRLKKPLLMHEDEGDALACLTVSWIILRFMGDIPEGRHADTVSQLSSTINSATNRRGRRLSSLVGLDQKILRRNKKKLGGGARKPSAIPEEPENLPEEEDLLVGEGTTLDRPLTALEKLHIIAGYGLTRKDIRDEIYCQICKQLVNNRDRNSREQGWRLLALCLGIFPPTDLFMKYLEKFLQRGQQDYKVYCTKRLQRIVANGERRELPCWMELQASVKKELINVSVTLTDGRIISMEIDSASTSAEVCQSLAEEIGLKDTFGFSLYISFFDKMWSLSSCGKHVLDAVSVCEQEMRRQGGEEKDTPWMLSLRKEIFSPWHNCSLDPISTDLIYKQVIKGVKSGDYTCEKEDEYVLIAAMDCYIRFSSDPTKEKVQRVVQDCIPTTLIENKSMAKWVQLITAKVSGETFARQNPSSEEVKGGVVDIAREKWPLEFSKFYEVTMTSGPPLPKSRFVMAVNSSGIFFMERKDRTFLDISYIEVKKVEMATDSVQSVNLSTIRGEFVLKSIEADDMKELLENNLEGLRKLSVYAVAQQDVSKPGDPMYLVCKRGDLLLVKKGESNSARQGWIQAVNKRSNTSGSVKEDNIQFLPTLTEPTEEMLNLLSPKQKKMSIVNNTLQGEETVAPVSLKEFALENFRSVSKDGGRHNSGKGANKEKLWVSSKEPLKQPLLKMLLNNQELSNLACNAFTAILKYMGDYPIKHARSPIELTEQIFGPATQNIELQDEIYCQIMKQMTGNGSRLSMERGWQLMWLCTGLFPPSLNLRNHTKRFLESRPRDPLAAVSLQRIQEICSKEPRKLPPHQAEVDAIQQNSTVIFYKVHFPNNTDDIFEVTSTTTIKDLRISIASQLGLNSADGYGLYMKTTQKIVSLEEQKYFFDNLRQPFEAPKKGKKTKEATVANIPCLVIFKRKLWFNVMPGKDLVADLTFHFPQAMPKYLRGYHNCTKEEMFNLGGLLFRALVDSDRSQFVMIPRMLKDLVPADQISTMSPEEWKKNIIASYNKQSGITVQEAKVAFLQSISSWPTFGSAFFEVKQTCDNSYPSPLWIAISKQGVSLIDPVSKELLMLHQFSRITEYGHKGNTFQMTIRTLVQGINFVCESPMAYAIEDLIRSYVKMYEGQKQVVRPKNNLFFRGFSGKIRD
ncbi:unconventional myosin-VIIa [Oryzias latipes]|uniref:unconventional myosin-VIIa n=1 Tax=Oryzias latipes TaxID=8090 RepID=UPI0005CBE447|nr:unconventional myosin-VIIa [Oryzias latipes]XP_011484716.1 unconventional myosin-VIIa [Oryzias latipes]